MKHSIKFQNDAFKMTVAALNKIKDVFDCFFYSVPHSLILNFLPFLFFNRNMRSKIITEIRFSCLCMNYSLGWWQICQFYLAFGIYGILKEFNVDSQRFGSIFTNVFSVYWSFCFYLNKYMHELLLLLLLHL